MKTLLTLALLVAGADLGPRVEVLKTHLERMRPIEVDAGLQPEKEKRFADLETLLDGPIETDEAFKEAYLKMDETRSWLWEHGANRPRAAEGEFKATDNDWIVETPSLKLRVNKTDLSVVIDTGPTVWKMAPSDANDLRVGDHGIALTEAASKEVAEFRTGYSLGLLASFSDFEKAPGLKVYCSIHFTGNEAVFEIAANETESKLESVEWPKAIVFHTTDPDDSSVIPLMQGMLLPANWDRKVEYLDRPMDSRYFYMPWWGQIRGGHGVQTIVETPDDAGGSYSHPAGGPTTVRPKWYSSLGSLRYARRIRYVFSENASYLTMAKRYRRYAKETGHFVSLDEKLARTPALAEVVGRPVLHLGSLYHFVPESQFYKEERIEGNHNLTPLEDLAENLVEVKKRGLGDAYIHLDGWGYFGYDSGHPDVLPPGEEQGGWEGLRKFADTCDELGYLFAVHDQYRDFYFNAASFDDRLVQLREDGGREEHSTWCGGPQTILSPRFAPGYVRKNHDLFAENGVKVRGAYLDVFAVVPLEESFQPGFPLSRTECRRHRKECFDLLRSRGYVVSSEEPVDYAVPFLDLVHHGPYKLEPDQGNGEGVGIPVPLFSLVYHDSILLPWDMGESGAWGIPQGDAGRLHCLLNGGLPYAGTGASKEALEKIGEAAELAKRVGTEEMVDHQFVDGNRRKQRTVFEDGTTVTVDFETKDYTIEYAAPSP
jgi:hypothetical protein